MTVRWATFLAALLVSGAPAPGETLLAARTIRAQAIIGPDDVTVADAIIPGALRSGDEAVGLEARVVLYAGRPIRPGDVGPPAIVERNQVVVLIYRQAGLSILAEGRSLGRGGVGDALRAMNMTSRTTVSGEIGADGTILVHGSDR